MTTHIETFANNGLSEPFYWLTRPTAVYHNGKTYVVWHGSNFDPYITYYDHTTKEWDQVRWVADNPMVNNGHGAPAMTVDSNGYIHVFYGATIGGGYPLRHAISNNPESISSFTVKSNIGKYNYPKPINIGNTLYLFAMGPSETDNSGAQYLSYRIWNGSSWGAYTSILSANTGINTYVGFMEYRNNRVHVTWCFYDRGADKMMNIYYAYLNMSDLNMYSANGTNLGSIISKSKADTYCIVRNSGSNNSNTASMHLDSNGYPWIIYPEGSDTNWRFYHTRWTGSSWTSPAYITSTDDMYNYEDFKINSVNDVTAYIVTEGSSGPGGDVEQWRWNGAEWSKEATILSQAASGKPLNGCNIPYNTQGIDVLFSQYKDEDAFSDAFTDNTLKLYAVIDDSTDSTCPQLQSMLTITPTTIVSGGSFTFISMALGGEPSGDRFRHEIFIGNNRVYDTGIKNDITVYGLITPSNLSIGSYSVTSKITDGCLPTNQTALSSSVTLNITNIPCPKSECNFTITQ